MQAEGLEAALPAASEGQEALLEQIAAELEALESALHATRAAAADQQADLKVCTKLSWFSCCFSY